jgi:hypothetical protein
MWDISLMGQSERVAGAAAMLLACVFAVSSALAADSAADLPAERSAALTQDPLVMRLSKDEFRIAFGVNTQGCVSNGCNGVIHYRAEWKTEDGTVISEFKRVSYNVVPHHSRTITVDRQYFDTAEGAHTTNVVRVTVDTITCVDGVYANSTPSAAAAAAPSAAF